MYLPVVQTTDTRLPTAAQPDRDVRARLVEVGCDLLDQGHDARAVYAWQEAALALSWMGLNDQLLWRHN